MKNLVLALIINVSWDATELPPGVKAMGPENLFERSPTDAGRRGLNASRGWGYCDQEKVS
jgi:hypothetical protein